MSNHRVKFKIKASKRLYFSVLINGKRQTRLVVTPYGLSPNDLIQIIKDLFIPNDRHKKAVKPSDIVELRSIRMDVPGKMSNRNNEKMRVSIWR